MDVALLKLLAVDAAWISDGGGKVRAAFKPVLGNAAIARFVMGVIGRHVGHAEFRYVQVNGETGVALYFERQLISVMSILTDGVHILEVFSILNPDKLSQMGAPLRLVNESH